MQLDAHMESRSPDPDRPTRLSLEERIGKRWSTWTGAVALLFAAGFYLQLAAGRGWLGPIGKIAIAIAAGTLAVVAGDRATRRDARVLGQGLIGVGIGVVFGALYAGHALYDLYDPRVAAFALIGVTTVGMLLAVRHDAAPIAVIAVLGGYLTPALASSGGDPGEQREILFAYLTVLDLGVLGVALARRWRALERLAFAGTWVLFAAWYHRTAAPDPTLTLVWCAVFFAIFLAVPLAYHLRRQIALSRDRLALVVIDGAVGFGFACEILDGDAAHLGRVALALAAAYAGLTALVRRRLRGDGLAYAVFAIVAAAFATLAVPLALRAHGIMLAWALEAPVLVWLGSRYRLALVRHAGAAVVALAALRLISAHLPMHGEPFTPFLNPTFASAFAVAIAAALYGWGAQRSGARFGDRFGVAIGIASSILAAVLVLALVHAELGGGFRQAGYHHGARLAVLAWWLVATAGLLAVAWRRSTVAWLAAAVTAAGATLVSLGVALLPPAPALVFVNPRFALLVATAGALIGLWRCERRLAVSSDPSCLELRRWVRVVTPAVVVAGLFLAVTIEAWQQASAGVDDPVRASWLVQAALSCAWSAFAAAALAVGFRLRVTALRVYALALFGVTVAKVAIVDLGRVEQIYRVASFLVLGLLLFTASWLYHRGGARRS